MARLVAGFRSYLLSSTTLNLPKAATYAQTYSWEAVAAMTRQVYVQAQADWRKKMGNTTAKDGPLPELN